MSEPLQNLTVPSSTELSYNNSAPQFLIPLSIHSGHSTHIAYTLHSYNIQFVSIFYPHLYLSITSMITYMMKANQSVTLRHTKLNKTVQNLISLDEAMIILSDKYRYHLEHLFNLAHLRSVILVYNHG